MVETMLQYSHIDSNIYVYVSRGLWSLQHNWHVYVVVVYDVLQCSTKGFCVNRSQRTKNRMFQMVGTRLEFWRYYCCFSILFVLSSLFSSSSSRYQLHVFELMCREKSESLCLLLLFFSNYCLSVVATPTAAAVNVVIVVYKFNDELNFLCPLCLIFSLEQKWKLWDLRGCLFVCFSYFLESSLDVVVNAAPLRK